VSRAFNQTKKNIALKAKEGRKLLKLSQEAFADACGIDRTYASQIERGIANPSLEVLCRIADVLGTTIEELVSSS